MVCSLPRATIPRSPLKTQAKMVCSQWHENNAITSPDEIKFYLETKEQLKVLKNLTEGLMKNAKIEYIDQSFNPEKKLAKEATKKEKQ